LSIVVVFSLGCNVDPVGELLQMEMLNNCAIIGLFDEPLITQWCIGKDRRSLIEIRDNPSAVLCCILLNPLCCTI
jgi:hypothetical protein